MRFGDLLSYPVPHIWPLLPTDALAEPVGRFERCFTVTGSSSGLGVRLRAGADRQETNSGPALRDLAGWDWWVFLVIRVPGSDLEPNGSFLERPDWDEKDVNGAK